MMKSRLKRIEIKNPGPLRIEEMIQYIEDMARTSGFSKEDWFEFDAGRQCSGQIVLRKDETTE